MLAERLPGILPLLDYDAALEVSAVQSVAGTLPPAAPLRRCPPYQAPHHSATMPGLVGGGSRYARPGAISLAHRGVLFMDEAPEFGPGVLDALREPLERGEITISRSGGVARYPARFQLVLAANPCPCGPVGGPLQCECTSAVRRRYRVRLSGPLLDRIDMHISLMAVTPADLLADHAGLETSEVVGKRVVEARAATLDRLAGTPWRLNAEVSGAALRSRWRLSRRTTAPAIKGIDEGWLTARGFDRVLRVAWSIADLGGRVVPNVTDVEEAVSMRSRLVPS
jgi:magnesium chelatase family protein